MERHNPYKASDRETWVCPACGLQLVHEGETIHCGQEFCPLPSSANVDTRLERKIVERQMAKLAELMEIEL